MGPHQNDVALVPPPTLNHQTSDPLAGGLEVHLVHPDGSTHACTLGFVARRNGQLGLVTASHCTSGTYGLDNNDVFQLFPREVGTESVDPYGYTCGFFSECRGSDAAFFASGGGVEMAVGLIMRTTFPNGGGLSGGLGSLEVDPQKPHFIVTAQENNDLVAGTVVNKMGRTTGWTHGTIKQTCVDHYLEGNHLIRCAYEASYVADHGDSGAPVWVADGFTCSRCVKLAGIHNGRATPGNDQARFSKLARIKSDMDGTWEIVRGVALPAPSLSGSISGVNPVLTWSAVAGATIYRLWVLYQSQVCLEGLPRVWVDNWEIVGETSGLSLTDTSGWVTTYSGSTPTNVNGERRYWVVAESTSDYSPWSNFVYFQP